jgi:Fic family protein
MKNTYEHIRFSISWKIDERISHLLGQCYGYIQAITGTPIRPDYRKELLTLSLIKGAHATTAIEGNTLSEEDIKAIQNGKKMPPSKEYLQKEVQNIINAFNTILNELLEQETAIVISSELIRRFHFMVGTDIGDTFQAQPGYFRRNNVIVGQYRPPSFEQVEELVEKLCTWLHQHFHYKAGQNFDESIIQAIVTHLYIVWIHPFGDGNGRTARLLEFYLLLRAGVPDIASHILSNHYNETRSEYYRQLQNATETGNLTSFIYYALSGFRDGLEGVLSVIHASQIEMTWRNYIDDSIGEFGKKEHKSEKLLKRIRELAYYIPDDSYSSIPEIRMLHIHIAEEYKAISDQTMARDIALLKELQLVAEEKKKFRSRKEALRMFMPITMSNIKPSH